MHPNAFAMRQITGK